MPRENLYSPHTLTVRHRYNKNEASDLPYIPHLFVPPQPQPPSQISQRDVDSPQSNITWWFNDCTNLYVLVVMVKPSLSKPGQAL